MIFGIAAVKGFVKTVLVCHTDGKRVEQQPLLLKHSLFHFDYLDVTYETFCPCYPLEPSPSSNHQHFPCHESESKEKCSVHDTLMSLFKPNQNSGHWCFCSLLPALCHMSWAIFLQSIYSQSILLSLWFRVIPLVLPVISVCYIINIFSATPSSPPIFNAPFNQLFIVPQFTLVPWLQSTVFCFLLRCCFIPVSFISAYSCNCAQRRMCVGYNTCETGECSHKCPSTSRWSLGYSEFPSKTTRNKYLLTDFPLVVNPLSCIAIYILN